MGGGSATTQTITITGNINFNEMDWDFIILRSKGDFSKAVALLKEEI